MQGKEENVSVYVQACHREIVEKYKLNIKGGECSQLHRRIITVLQGKEPFLARREIFWCRQWTL